MVSRHRDNLPPWHHYNKTGEWLTLHMDTENRWPQARAQNNIYRRPMYSSRKLTRTRGGAGGSREQYSRSQACPGQGAGTPLLWEGEGGQPELLTSASGCLSPRPEQRDPPMAPCTGEGGYARVGDSAERGPALAQTHLHQFSANSENIDKIEGGSPAAYKGGVPAARPGLCLHVPALSPSASCSQPKSLPPLGTSPPPDPTALRLPMVLPHWLENTILPQQQCYCSCRATCSLMRGC